jgi:N utilization substance protein A
MIDYKQFMSAIQQIAEEKGISKERIIETIEMAVAAAYKKDYGQKDMQLKAKLDPETGGFEVNQLKLVVTEDMLKEEDEEEIAAEEEKKEGKGLRKDEKKEREHEKKVEEPTAEESEEEQKKVRFNPQRHIMLADAKKIKKGVEPGEELVFPLEQHEDFGRIAAQTAKQVIIQRIKEAERETIFDEFKGKEGMVVSAVIQRIEGRNIYFDLGKAVGVMFPSERVHMEHYRVGQRLKVFIYAVELTPKGPNIYVSRSHPKLISKLFEMEVPEIASKAVEIRSVAREAGARSKVAVMSNQEGVDPIGSCVGQKGMRIMTIINELGGEKVDIVEWSDLPEKFIGYALSPAKAMGIELDKKDHVAKIIVPDDQLSLAIGKGGQNVRLAAKLTGWKIDVRSAGAPEETVESADATEPGSEAVEETLES